MIKGDLIKCYLAGLFILLVSLMAEPAFATHIVGGEMTYICTGNNQYQVRLDIYQDCIEGEHDAIAQDLPGFFALFEGNGNPVNVDTAIPYAFNPIIVPTNFSNNCLNNPPRTCLRKATFIKNYFLTPNSTGYYIVYQRCCRNISVKNINNPGTVGATYFCHIPPAGIICNNSAVFKNYPPQIICISNPLVYDHSATDADGDSLSYEFCSSYEGGSSGNAKPIPYSTNFIPVRYSNGYSSTIPVRGTPALQIDAQTGLITGTPSELGRYVVTVCCNEWRGGKLINTVKREFQFVIANCSKAVVANIPQYSDEFNTYIVNCKNKTIHFDNISTGGFAYNWDFGVLNRTDDTSNQLSPTFTYSDTGTYIVKLVVNRGSTCPDSIVRFVKIYPDFAGDFEMSGLPCPNAEIKFKDLSTSTYKPINTWKWDFGDGNGSNLQNPTHHYSEGGNYNIVFISKNVKGCSDTVRKEIDVEKFKPFSGIKSDTIIVKDEHINFRGSGGVFYTWTPSTYLNNPFISDPVGYYPDTTFITYIVHIKSEVGCEGDDTISVRVVNQSTLFVPTGFSPNGDGINDILRPIGIGYRKINYFRVYNRWGQEVFYTVYFGEGWDGRIGGKEADLGTYFWQLSTVDRFGNDEKIHGDATLIR